MQCTWLPFDHLYRSAPSRALQAGKIARSMSLSRTVAERFYGLSGSDLEDAIRKAFAQYDSDSSNGIDRCSFPV
jgi:hypothetical protein